MTLTPSEIGARAEAAVATALVQAGKDVLLPVYGAHRRYDLVFEDPRGFHRVQCKTGRWLGEVIYFRASSNTNNLPESYRGQIDFFGVYCHERQAVYLVPVDHVPDVAAHLRLSPPRNGQSKGIRWASDYLLR